MTKEESKNKFAVKVTVADFEKFKQEVNENQTKILDILEKMGSSSKKVVGESDSASFENSSGLIDSHLPVQYKVIFEKYFDPDDGFEAKLVFPESGGAIMFSISVPLKISNATQAHKDFYKKDTRDKALSPSDIAGGIEKWCKLVAKNLNYNRNLKRK